MSCQRGCLELSSEDQSRVARAKSEEAEIDWKGRIAWIRVEFLDEQETLFLIFEKPVE